MKTMKNPKKPARSSMTKSALTRLYIIDRLIASGRYPNTKQLERHLCDEWGEVSTSTVSRDIEFLRDRWHAPIAYDASRRGYFYTKRNYRIPTGFSGADELLALSMVKNILTLYKDTPIYDSAKELLDNITAPFATAENPAWYESRIVVPQVPSIQVPSGLWNIISTALKENRILSFLYQGTYDESYKTRRVRPYQLLFDNGLWYLYGYSEERRGIRIFSLGRIKNIILTKDCFALPENFDYRIGNSGSYFGVFMGQKKQRFKVAFYDYSLMWAKDRKWAEDQKITETDDGVIVSFTSSQFEKVLEWVLSRGSTAHPLEPERLVNEWRSHIEEMKKIAGLK